MKSRLLALCLGLLVQYSSIAHGGKLSLDLRGDYDATTYNSASTRANTSSFIFQTGRLDYKGEVNEDISYRLRLRFNNESTTTGPDSLSSRVDYASITHQLKPVSLTFGKFNVDVGGHETIGDSMDDYMKSEAQKALTGSYTGTAGTFFTAIKYSMGAKIGYQDEVNSLSFMAFNNPDSESATSPKAQSRLFSGVVYKGKFLDKKLKPVISYHSGDYNNESTTSSLVDSKSTLISAGLKWEEDGGFAQIDVNNLRSAELNATDRTYLRVQSTVFEGGLNYDAWRPRLKLESSQTKETPTTAASTELKYTGVSLALEYKPYADKNFRYHLVHTRKTTSADGVDDKIESHVLLGFATQVDL